MINNLQKEFDEACLHNEEISLVEMDKIQQDIDLIRDLFYDESGKPLYV